MSGGLVVDLFAGAGGWGVGLERLGRRHVGIELDRAACAVAVAAGHPRIRADVTAYPQGRFDGIDGLVASPPCQPFSRAGRRRGLEDPRGPLVWEPGRWVRELRPGWVCFEQVPEVEPIWRLEADRLRQLGYSAWSGLVDAADWGVPQNRRRAVLVASRLHRVAPPVPTHCEGGRDQEETLLGSRGRLGAWVTMAEALGWGAGGRPVRTICGARQPRWLYGEAGGAVLRTTANTRRSGGIERYERRVDRPSPVIDTKAYKWTVRSEGERAGGASGWALPDETLPGDLMLCPGSFADGRGGHRRLYGVDELAPTLALGHDVAGWCWARPATTVQATARIARPGHHESQWAGSLRVSIAQLGVLQGFPADYPWAAAATTTAASRCVGNAIPPPLAAALIAAAAGRAGQS